MRGRLRPYGPTICTFSSRHFRVKSRRGTEIVHLLSVYFARMPNRIVRIAGVQVDELLFAWNWVLPVSGPFGRLYSIR
jgi:hypothetical protein